MGCRLTVGLEVAYQRGKAGAAAQAHPTEVHLCRAVDRIAPPSPGPPAHVVLDEAGFDAAVAALRAGNAALASAECTALAHRERPEERYDQLCAASMLAAAGDRPAAIRRLAGFVPSAPEHAALAGAITGPPGTGDGRPADGRGD
jgi:hypothetical protein